MSRVVVVLVCVSTSSNNPIGLGVGSGPVGSGVGSGVVGSGVVYGHEHRLFVGPKIRKDLMERADNLELAIDMGWFFFC